MSRSEANKIFDFDRAFAWFRFKIRIVLFHLHYFHMGRFRKGAERSDKFIDITVGKNKQHQDLC